MARPLRITYPGAFYYVTSRGKERKAVFKSKPDREKFLEYLESGTWRYDAVIHAYCLMDNHYHLLVETPSGNLPQIMRHINGAYTTYFNINRARSGQLFQGRYKALLVDVDEYAKELSRYMHLNPVRAQMRSRPEGYAWSSYRSYIGKRKSPEWLKRDLILDYFAAIKPLAEKRYRGFVNELLGVEYKSPLSGVVGSTLLGSQSFVDFIKANYIYGQKPDEKIPALQELADRPSIAQISAVVDTFSWKEAGLSRSVKMYLCRQYSGARLKEIGAFFGIGESGISQASRRIEERMNSSRALKRKMKGVENKLFLSSMKP